MPDGINIAFASDTFETSPTWVRIDDPTYPAIGTNSNLVSSWTTNRGRQYELDKTQAGTATITCFDSTGRLDPTNAAGPYFGSIGPLRQLKINAQDPVTKQYHDIFTGFVESWNYTVDPTERLLTVTINATDAFELLARAEVVPDGTGTTTYAAAQVNDRIKAALADAGWPSAWENIFTGNVDMQATIYNPQTTLLSVMQDAADAEFPNVANVFMDKFGNVAFRGRWPRFYPDFFSADPPTPSKPMRTWHVGDRAAAQTFGYAPISNIEWVLDLKNVINACLCTPYGIAQADISTQLFTDGASIATYGTRVLSITDLLVSSSIAGPVSGPPGHAPGGDGVGAPAADANTETGILAQYYIDNYAQPVEMISAIEFGSLAPTDSLAAPLWKFLTGVEIGDVIVVTQRNPGGGGFRSKQFFVEGIHNTVAPLQGSFPDWKMTLDLSPREWYQKFDGVTYFVP